MRAKGNNPAHWNWQVYDKQEGFFPNEEDKVDEDKFDLDKELAQVEQDLREEGYVLRERNIQNQSVVLEKINDSLSKSIKSPIKSGKR